MPQYQMRGNRKGHMAKGYIALADVNRAIAESQEVLKNNIELVNQSTAAINMLNSSLNAMNYKIEEVKNQIITLSGQMGYISGMAPVLSTAQSNLSEYSRKIENNFRELDAGLMAMVDSSKKIDEFLSQPGIRRTMEDLTDISNRYDSLK